jgi:magnesium transporter
LLVFDGHEVKREANRRPSDNEMVFMALRCPKQDEIRQVLGKMYDCHDLVIEDCLRKEQHPKLNIYNDHAFFPFFFLKEDWELVQISVVMGKNFVIAILSEEMSFLAGLEQEFQQSPEKMKDPGRIL